MLGPLNLFMRKFTSVLAAISLAGFAASTAIAGAEACSATKTEACSATKTEACCATKTVANLKLDGIKCGDCATKAETALLKVKGVTSAHVCADSHVATVEFDKAKTSQRKIASAAKKAGFKATVVKS